MRKIILKLSKFMLSNSVLSNSCYEFPEGEKVFSQCRSLYHEVYSRWEYFLSESPQEYYLGGKIYQQLVFLKNSSFWRFFPEKDSQKILFQRDVSFENLSTSRVVFLRGEVLPKDILNIGIFTESSPWKDIFFMKEYSDEGASRPSTTDGRGEFPLNHFLEKVFP